MKKIFYFLISCLCLSVSAQEMDDRGYIVKLGQQAPEFEFKLLSGDTINNDVLKIDETKLFKEEVTVFGNLPYNISTEILSKWIINLKDNFWFECLVLMFQKEVADRIIAEFNTSNYGRLSIICNWKLNIKKICDIEPEAFFPKPKIYSSLLLLRLTINKFNLF